ncbi:MAG: recombination-associated protein RdgC [Aeromonas sp.]
MWFKNLQLFRLTQPFSHSVEALESLLATDAFTPCASQDISRFGWVKPLGKQGDSLCHANRDALLICARKEEKMVPSHVVKAQLADKIEQLELEFNRPLKKSEKQSLKEEVMQTLLPRAFSRLSQTRAWICAADDLLIVEAGSVKKADDLLSLLRKALGSLPVVPLTVAQPAQITLTAWLNDGHLAPGFSLEEEAELRSVIEHGGIIRCKEQELLCDEIKQHLANDKQVTKLALNWQERVSFVLGEDLSLKRLKFSDALREQNEDIPREDVLARLDADFTLMSSELRALVPALVAALGGELPRLTA